MTRVVAGLRNVFRVGLAVSEGVLKALAELLSFGVLLSHRFAFVETESRKAIGQPGGELGDEVKEDIAFLIADSERVTHNDWLINLPLNTPILLFAVYDAHAGQRPPFLVTEAGDSFAGEQLAEPISAYDGVLATSQKQ